MGSPAPAFRRLPDSSCPFGRLGDCVMDVACRLGQRYGVDRFEQLPMIEPIDPVQRRGLDGCPMRLRSGCCRMTSVLNKPITVSARSLSYDLPTRPANGVIPTSVKRCL